MITLVAGSFLVAILIGLAVTIVVFRSRGTLLIDVGRAGCSGEWFGLVPASVNTAIQTVRLATLSGNPAYWYLLWGSGGAFMILYVVLSLGRVQLKTGGVQTVVPQK